MQQHNTATMRLPSEYYHIAVMSDDK